MECATVNHEATQIEYKKENKFNCMKRDLVLVIYHQWW
jgi:hypothetical protein